MQLKKMRSEQSNAGRQRDMGCSFTLYSLRGLECQFRSKTYPPKWPFYVANYNKVLLPKTTPMPPKNRTLQF